MKILSALLVFCALAFTNCQKSIGETDETDARIIRTAAFENSQFKIERASTSLPETTTKIHFFDELNGICLTGGDYNIFETQNAHKAGGSIYTTNDGGSTWTTSYSFSKIPSDCLRPLGFEVLNDNTIVAFAGSSMCHPADPNTLPNSVIRSTDKGKSWAINPTMTDLLTSMTLGDNNTLYIIGRIKNNHENTVFDSKDGGLSWNKSAIKTPFGSLSKIMNLSPKKLLIMGSIFDDTNPRLTSTDNGLNWEKNTGSDVMMGVSHSEKMGLYLSQQKQQFAFNVYETHNGGDSWTNMRTFTSTTNEVKVLSATTALILGRSDGELNARFSFTLDGGKTWTDKILVDNGYVGELITSSFYSPRSGYIVGANSILYKMTFKQ